MISELENHNRSLVDEHIRKAWAGPFIVSRGVVHDSATLPGFIATNHGRHAGAVLYHIHDKECEIVVLYALSMRQGIGTALVNAVVKFATQAGCKRVWLVTTNDNKRAMEFYRRYGFSLKQVHYGACRAARALKPELPEIGEQGICIEDELEFELCLAMNTRTKKG
ncbi:MAG: GNAT family N-acetyltransferase [Sphaerochaetaceae bacterium]